MNGGLLQVGGQGGQDNRGKRPAAPRCAGVVRLVRLGRWARREAEVGVPEGVRGCVAFLAVGGPDVSSANSVDSRISSDASCRFRGRSSAVLGGWARRVRASRASAGQPGRRGRKWVDARGIRSHGWRRGGAPGAGVRRGGRDGAGGLAVAAAGWSGSGGRSRRASAAQAIREADGGRAGGTSSGIRRIGSRRSGRILRANGVWRRSASREGLRSGVRRHTTGRCRPFALPASIIRGRGCAGDRSSGPGRESHHRPRLVASTVRWCDDAPVVVRPAGHGLGLFLRRRRGIAIVGVGIRVCALAAPQGAWRRHAGVAAPGARI